LLIAKGNKYTAEDTANRNYSYTERKGKRTKNEKRERRRAKEIRRVLCHF